MPSFAMGGKLRFGATDDKAEVLLRCYADRGFNAARILARSQPPDCGIVAERVTEVDSPLLLERGPVEATVRRVSARRR